MAETVSTESEAGISKALVRGSERAQQERTCKGRKSLALSVVLKTVANTDMTPAHSVGLPDRVGHSVKKDHTQIAE